MTDAAALMYTVTVTLPDSATADEFVGWLLGGHAAAVVAGGASRAEVVRLDPDAESGGGVSRVVEARYQFPSRRALEVYLRDHAPGLRAEGMARFGPERGVSMRRTIGERAGVVGAGEGPVG